ncbi:hypothetical protein ACJW30_03G180500 [Castanea mollissima]
MLMRSLLESSTLLKEVEHLCLNNCLPETALHLKSQSSRPRQSCKSNASTPLPPISLSLHRVKLIEDLTEEKVLKMRVSFTISHTPKIDHALHCSINTHLLQLKTVTAEVNNQDDSICALLCHFSALDSHGKPNNFLLLE